ncbi:sensor histidine kinase [Nocardioides pinisoli]|uniref:histidine kinase n=1 Tax=Nocardioides pinisoli TaxID=2950279 RepID=A0ABT1KX61_9ACTN|nr:histidine kinase [Nocardioides pinisoli]MCP3421929.1 histidine kinase [Nocardioides pinisoli]
MDWPRGRDPHLFPLLAAPVMGVLAVAEASLDETFRPDLGPLTLVALWIATSFLVAIRFPATGCVLMAGFYPVGVVVGAPGPGGAGLISVLLAVGWAGYAAPARRSMLGTTLAVLVFIATDATQHGLSWDTIFFPAAFYPGRWAGTLVQREQTRTAQLVELTAVLDAQREATAHAAVVEERTRIAREVHDAVAHSVSVMTLQVGGLRRQLAEVLEERPDERDVMLGIERLGRQSVEELRSLVGILRESGNDEPAAVVPSLRRVPELVADVRAAGLPVELSTSGAVAELPRALDVSAYRIIQEALTNVLRHAPQAQTRVRVSYAPDVVELAVENDPPRHPAGAPHPTDAVGGHGLVGMRERAAMFGGTLTTAPSTDGGFTVCARLPLTGRWR